MSFTLFRKSLLDVQLKLLDEVSNSFEI